MANKIATEVELSRENKIVLSKAMGHFNTQDIKSAIKILDEEANDLLALRRNSNGESPVRGTGEVLGNIMILNVTVPIDTRYSQNDGDFNAAWSERMRDELGVISGGYVERESREVVPTRIVIETDGTAEEVARALGNLATVVG
jgi:hypothetical protein